MIHELKILPIYFYHVEIGSKNFEVRKNDRDFSVGDGLILKEYNKNNGYTGRIVHRRITYILDSSFEGISNGYVVMGLEKL